MPEPARKSLYHYTSAEALLGILRNRTLRLTDFRYLNDSAELRVFLSALKNAANECPLPTPEPNEHDAYRHLPADYRRDFLEYLEHALDALGFLGLACFSTAPNDLAQWRAYTPVGTGVVIEFSRSLLEQWASDDGYGLIECDYSHATLDDLARNWVARIDSCQV